MALHGKFSKTAAAVIAAVAVVSGCGVTHHGSIAVTHPAKNLTISHTTISHTATTHQASTQPVSASRPAADPSLAWLVLAGGQAQVTFNQDVDNLGLALEAEDNSPTVANHLASEADASIVLAEADKIMGTPALLPKVGRAGYERMLNDFIVVANLLEPGACYCTIAQVETAWYTAVGASNITVS
jgi:hypothetical protein